MGLPLSEVVIACVVDEKYASSCAAMLASVCASTPGPLRIICLDSGLTPRSQEWLATVCRGERILFQRISLSTHEFSDLPPLEGSHTTYLKLRLIELAVTESDRLLYLDSDMIVLADLRPLFEASFGDALLLAQEEYGGGGGPQFHYFNAGFLLIHLARWKSEAISERALAWMRENRGRVKSQDQDGLNSICRNRWKKMGYGWNLTGHYFTWFTETPDASRRPESQGVRHPKAIHLTPGKPNSLRSPHPFVADYWRFHFRARGAFLREALCWLLSRATHGALLADARLFNYGVVRTKRRWRLSLISLLGRIKDFLPKRSRAKEDQRDKEAA